MSTRKRFDHDLRHLKSDIYEMGDCIVETLVSLQEIMKHPNDEKLQELIEHDRYINELQKNIESRCLSILLKQQPVARDLRLVSTGLKIVTDLERIGDQCADIAHIIIKLNTENIYTDVKHIPSMLDILVDMVKDTVEAMKNSDLELASKTKEIDQQINQLFKKCKSDIIKLIKNDDCDVDQYLEFLMIAKYLEKIGDHAVNTCEWIEFNQTGMIDDYRIV